MSDEQTPYTDYPEDDDLARFRPSSNEEDLNATSEAHRTELLRQTTDSFDERLGRVRSRKMSPSSLPQLHRKRHWAVLPVTLLVLLVTGALVVLALLLPPFSQNSPVAELIEENEDGGFSALTSDETRFEKEGLVVEVHPGDPGKDFRVALTKVTASEYLAGTSPSENCPTSDTLPASPVGDVFGLDVQGTPPNRIGLNIAFSQESVDLYGWFGNVWSFVPSQPSADRKALVTDLPVLPQCIVMVQAADTHPELSLNLDLGQTRSDAISPNRLFIRGMQPTLQGTLQGILPADTPTDVNYPVIPLIANYIDPNAVDASTVEAILRSPELRIQHAANIAGFAEVNNYTTIALDYRGISPELRNQLSDLIKNIAEGLHSQNRQLIVVVPPAEFGNSWQTGAYDWRVLGLLADEIILRAPLNADAFLPNGDVDSMLQWAVGEISRAKLSLGLSVLSIESAPESPARLVAIEDVWEGLGDVAFNEGTAYVVPGRESSAFLNTPYQTRIGLDETIQAPYVTYLNENDDVLRTFWLMTASALHYRMQKAEQFNLRGVFVADIYASGVEGSVLDALFAYQSDAELETGTEQPLMLHWVVYDSAGETIAEADILPGTSFNFTPPQDEAALGVEISITGYGQVSETDVIIATPTPGGEEASQAPAFPTALPTLTPQPTLTPTIGPTAIPALVEGKLPADFGLGGHISGVFDDTVYEPMRRAGMNWVKIQIRYERGLNPADEGWKIQLNNENGFNVLFAVVGHKEALLEPNYFDEYAEYVAGLAERGAGAIEVWNEMNLDREWPTGQIDPAMYTELLKKSYEAIKAANPNTLVISGALAPTGAEGAFGLGSVWNDDRYYQGLADAGAGQYMDCVGAHYNEGIVSPTETTGDPREPYPTRYLTLQTDRAWEPFNGEVPVCYTELGYLTPEGYGTLPSGFEWAENVTIEQQAAWLGTAALINAQSGKVILMIIWNIDYKDYGADPLAGYAIIRKDGSCPACDTLGSLR